MENNDIDTCKLLYNTERVRLYIPEYGRNVQKMVNYLKTIEDREKRNEQARAIIKVMEILNPAVHLEEDFEHKLWDHLYIISGFDLDIDAPYPMPEPESLNQKPEQVPMNTKPIKATHYGRNIENIIELIAGKEDGETKTAMIRQLAVYMRPQYFRIKVPEGLQLTRVDTGTVFARPGQNQAKGKMQNMRHKNNNMRMRKQHK